MISALAGAAGAVVVAAGAAGAAVFGAAGAVVVTAGAAGAAVFGAAGAAGAAADGAGFAGGDDVVQAFSPAKAMIRQTLTNNRNSPFFFTFTPPKALFFILRVRLFSPIHHLLAIQIVPYPAAGFESAVRLL